MVPYLARPTERHCPKNDMLLALFGIFLVRYGNWFSRPEQVENAPKFPGHQRAGISLQMASEIWPINFNSRPVQYFWQFSFSNEKWFRTLLLVESRHSSSSLDTPPHDAVYFEMAKYKLKVVRILIGKYYEIYLAYIVLSFPCKKSLKRLRNMSNSPSQRDRNWLFHFFWYGSLILRTNIQTKHGF